MNFEFIEMCSLWFNWPRVIISSIRRQAIIGTNDCLVYWRIYASLGLNEISE